jgi:hypothetical protein
MIASILGGIVPVLAIATSWLTGCATGFETDGVAVCLPLVEYGREFQARAC